MPPLPYHPRQGEVLWCDYAGFIKPEMVKKRLVVVVSPKFLGRRDLCTVVPLSTTAPDSIESYHHRLERSPLPTDPAEVIVWAKCDMLATVCFARLSGWWDGKTNGKRQYRNIYISDVDLAAIRRCMLFALGLGRLSLHL